MKGFQNRTYGFGDGQFWFDMFTHLYETIPNTLKEEKVNIPEFLDFFSKKYEDKIVLRIQNERNLKGDDFSSLDDTLLFFEDALVIFDTNQKTFRIYAHSSNSTLIHGSKESIKTFKIVDSQTEMNLIVSKENGFDLEALDFDTPSTKANIFQNYNEGFEKIHDIIQERLSSPDDKGIVLLHGDPGTGKTSYIRYLISKIENKKVIFLSPDLANSITGPDLMSLLINHKNSVLIIEDAEDIVMSRGQQHDSAVSALLNISDGLLSDVLNIQIVCTFNTDLSRIDKALLRKGRLIARYEFKPLEANRGTVLSRKVNHNIEYSNPVTLTEVMNPDEGDFDMPMKKAVGF